MAVGGEIYLNNEKLKDFPVPLLVDRDGLIDDLLAHEPGTFFYPGNTLNFTSTWEEATPAQVKDYLWYTLENSLFLFSFRVEFEVDMNRRNPENSPYSPCYSCYVGSFSEGVEPKSRSVGWGR
ncbi:hypothetical protein COCCU_06480 [Corynebacterium occultum]|uniref:Uncharacterized protein n=1 Tax=Corynebacterium occultum TaxID=2675219 RepID=A0A6B8W131_9CORY|nr:hypothetical protein COCCU_06480 [Corynebacterium occultum]